MCIYYILSYVCGHTALFSGPSCHFVFAQLQRINDLTNHVPPLSNTIPFDIPETCLPHAHNIIRLQNGQVARVQLPQIPYFGQMQQYELDHGAERGQRQPDWIMQQQVRRRTWQEEYCSVECRNDAEHGERVGEVDARYGPGNERWRAGIGWRRQNANMRGA